MILYGQLMNDESLVLVSQKLKGCGIYLPCFMGCRWIGLHLLIQGTGFNLYMLWNCLRSQQVGFQKARRINGSQPHLRTP